MHAIIYGVLFFFSDTVLFKKAVKYMCYNVFMAKKNPNYNAPKYAACVVRRIFLLFKILWATRRDSLRQWLHAYIDK